MVKVIVFHYIDRGKLPKLSQGELNGIMRRSGWFLLQSTKII